MVFEPAAAPGERAAFSRWYEVQTDWIEGHTYDDPSVTSVALQAWFMEMRQYFPPMNGPFRSDSIDDPTVADYCFGRHAIYVAFAWSVADAAYRKGRELAVKHRVGFYDVSGNDEILLPGETGS